MYYCLETTIDLDNLVKGEDLYIKIDKADFKHMCRNLFDKIIPLIEKALNDSK